MVDKNTSITLASSGQLTTSFSNGEAPIWTGGGSQSYKVEPITYVVDKNSVKFVSVTKSGKVTGLKSTGKKTAIIRGIPLPALFLYRIQKGLHRHPLPLAGNVPRH